jgi:hypothetical protein
MVIRFLKIVLAQSSNDVLTKCAFFEIGWWLEEPLMLPVHKAVMQPADYKPQDI